jgi:hypothetical protein
MDIHHLTQALQELPPAAQAEALVRFAYELTLLGRDAYEPGTLELRHPRRLRSLNEIQHHVATHVLALLTADPGRYPEEVLVAIFLEQDDPELQQRVAAAFARSLSSQAEVAR